MFVLVVLLLLGLSVIVISASTSKSLSGEFNERRFLVEPAEHITSAAVFDELDSSDSFTVSAHSDSRKDINIKTLN